jgi:peptide/nickel transport system ATP-binding protein/oligopeptide transport system ATP-binding protein
MDKLLDIQDLTVSFDTDDGPLRAVDRVSFHVRRGEVLGLVGESGCGKSVTALSLVRLIPSPPGRVEAGHVYYQGEDLLAVPVARLRAIRGQRLSMIFQEPMTALSPLHRVGRQLAETLQIHRRVSTTEAWRLGEEWLQKVGVPDPAERMYSYPHELSGGMRQRVVIAMALMLEPELVIADEPTTALDVTIQAQVLDLMRALKRRDSSLLLITHDMGVIWEMCDRVIVMYASRIAESGPRDAIFSHPLHPYTQGLLRSVPALAGEVRRLPSIPGQVPSLLHLPRGCHFAERCAHAVDQCRSEPPPLRDFEGDRQSACFLSDQWAGNA